jgi:hypothetical protein
MNTMPALYVLLGLIIAHLPSPASAQRSMIFTHFVVCPSSREPPCGSEAILARGTITSDTPAALEAFLRRTKISPSPTNRDRYVVFDSPGGSLGGGIQIGRMIRRYQLSTLMMTGYSGHTLGNPQREIDFDGASCASACSLAFLGGVTRISANFGGRIGVHQFASAGDRQIGDGITQITMTLLARYVDDMGVDRAFIDIASLTPPSSIFWLSSEQQQRLRVDNNFLESPGWQLIVLPDDTPAAEMRLGQSRSVQFFKRDGRSMMRVEFQTVDPRRAIETFASEPIWVSVNLGRNIFEVSGKVWRRGKGNLVEAAFEIPSPAMPQILKGESLNVRVGGTSMATNGLAPEGDFPMEGAAPKIRAALK